MIYPNCQEHLKPKNKVCRAADECKIMCNDCYLKDVDNKNYSIGICLNPQTISFFQTLSGYGYYKMFEWVDIIRKNGFFSLFEMTHPDRNLLESAQIIEQLGLLGIRALQRYQCLTKNNRQFVIDNKHSEHLYHPQFLKDIFNLITEKWGVSSFLIIKNLEDQVNQKLRYIKKTSLPSFKIKQYYLNLIESYRIQLLQKINKKVYCTPQDARQINLKKESDILCHDIQNNQQIAKYEIPYSIKQIESFQQIGQKNHINKHRNTNRSLSIEYGNRQQSQSTLKDLESNEISDIKRQMERLKLHSVLLQEQNQILSARNLILQRQKQELQAKIQMLIQQNKQNSERETTRIERKSSISGVRKIRIIK